MTRRSRRSSSTSSRMKLLVLAGLMLLLGACASDAPQDTLEPEGPIAREIDNLVSPVFLIAGVIFVIVNVGVLLVMLRYRHRHDQDDDEALPKQVHGNLKAELAWTIVPALILTAVAVLTVRTILNIDRAAADADMQVEVIGKQWWWEYRYDLNGDGNDDIITANDLVIPAGEAVRLNVTSADVIHSYWIPRLQGKIDAAPGRSHRLVLESDGPGTFVGQCTEFCGLSHAYMRQRVVALEQDEFDDWVANQLEDAQVPTPGTDAAAGEEIFTAVCSSCHLVRGINDAQFDEFGEGEDLLVAGRAPDLTHFMTRGAFAGALFDLWLPSDGPVVEWEDIGNELNREDLAAWLRDPPAEKPMDPDNGRGMPNFGLSEDDIDLLIAFLETLE